MRKLGFVLALGLFGSSLFAQSFTPVRELKNLSPAALEKLRTLEMLDALPAGEWRFHAGDLAHGESPALDDSKWDLVKPRSKAPTDAVWYRREIEVPKTLNGYDITGARVWFQFEADANGPMPEIIYFNGRRVALGDDLEPIVMFEPAKPGDKILVAVKLLHTVDQKTFRGVTLRVESDPMGTSSRPSPDDIRVQCITAANMLPVLSPARKDLLPKVEEAIAAIDVKALAAANQAAFDGSLRAAQKILTTLEPALATAKVDMAGNSHIDAAWLWPRSETIDVVHRTFTTALQLMNEYPDYTFTQSAAQYTEWMAEKYPELNEQIRKRVKEGRWEIVGGMWVEPDLNMPDGESLVRQLLVGQRYFKQQYGVEARIGWNPDSFGYNWQLPQIYKRSGLDYFVTQKMHWNDTNQLPFRLFWWESPDGSKVLTYFPTDYVHSNVSPTRISADYAESVQRNPGTTEMLDLYGIGDHGGGPTRSMLDQGDHWIAAGPTGSKQDAVPTMRYHTAQQYFSDVEIKLNADSPTWNYGSIATGYTAPAAGADGSMGLPTWKDELYFEYHRGVFTSQAKHKASMRLVEVKTLDAEKLASLAWLAGAAYPATDLTENWKKITFNQFHDLAAGSGISVIYKDAQRDYAEVFHVDKEISDGALSTLAARVDTSKQTGTPILVANTMAWPRSEVMEVTAQSSKPAEDVYVMGPKGPLPTQVVSRDAATNTFHLLVKADGVPALGYTTLALVDGKQKERSTASAPKVDEKADSFSLSNGVLALSIDKKTGCITSLGSASGAGSYLAPGACGNQLQTYKDTPKQYDAWNIDPGTLDGTMTPIEEVDSIALVDRGPVRATVRITRHWGKSKFTQDISLDTGADAVRVVNDVDWHEQHILLKAAFPLKASGPMATYEIPYGSIERTTTRSNSWEKAKFEVPAMRWADLGDASQGVSILNDSKYGYDAAGNVLRLTLLRSPTWPDAEADQGMQHFTYEIYPHAGTWKQAQTVRRGYELNTPLVAQQVFAHTGSLPAEHSWASVENANVTLTAIKKAEDSDALIFRMYEWAGTASEVKLRVPDGAQYAVESNLMEKEEGAHLGMSGGVVTVPIKPYEILTVAVHYPHQGAAR